MDHTELFRSLEVTKDKRVVKEVYSITKASNNNNKSPIKRALLYRLFNPETGEHSNQYGIELQFSNKDVAEQYLHLGNIKYEEIDDVEDFPL